MPAWVVSQDRLYGDDHVAVARDARIGGQQTQRLVERLRHQNAVERIGVDHQHFVNRASVPG